jgi:hypothetical protein
MVKQTKPNKQKTDSKPPPVSPRVVMHQDEVNKPQPSLPRPIIKAPKGK